VQPDSSAAIDYDRWNQAIVAWSVANYSEGDAVYLSVDEQTLHAVRRKYLGLSTGNAEDAVRDFQTAICSRVVHASERSVDLARVHGASSDGTPRCAALLAAFVFAAHQMEDDTEADDTAYFIRLCQFLKLPQPRKGYRPAGLELRNNQPTPEEPLWQRWNHWLVRRGFQETASRGEGKYRYSNYPISQAILRKGEKIRLAKWFRECERAQTLTRHCDRDLLAAQIPDAAASLTAARLKRLLVERSDSHRFDAIIDAVCEVYDAIDWDDPSSDLLMFGPRRLRAGLYRTEDFITGTVRFLLYPHMPRRWNGSALTVTRPDGAKLPLRMQRQGRFMPLWPVELGAERSYPLEGDEELTRLVLPKRDFWILIHDPDDDASAVLASWGVPTNGQTFLLVCHSQHVKQVAELRERKLMNWDEVVEVPQGNETWFEYRECQVESARWSSVLAHPGCEDLISALRPVHRVNVALEGGLRVPGMPVWLEGNQPELKLYQFGGTAELRVADAANLERSICPATVVNVNEPIQIPCLPPGEYVVVAQSGATTATRRLTIASWATLGARIAEGSFPLQVNGYLLRGASLQKLPG
jgi:hypothetical protein